MDTEIVDAVKYDPQNVDVEDIMRQIRTYLAQKQGRPTPASNSSAHGLMLDREVYDDLYEANEVYDKVAVAPHLTPVKVPIVGRIWQRLRGRLHALVVFYVGRTADAQVRFNAPVVRVLNGIVRGIDLDRTPERLERLEQRLEQLELQLVALRSAAATINERRAE